MAIKFQFKTLTQWPKKKTATRRRSPWRVNAVTVFRQLERELELIGATGEVYVEVSIDAKYIRRDGLPAATAPTPSFPGVVVYAPNTRKGAVRFVSDTYTDWMGNLRGISMTLTSLRAVDRYGAVQDAEQYKGFAALPPPATTFTADDLRRWATEQSGMHNGYFWSSIYRELAKRFHPDAGGNPEDWAKLQAANALLREGGR